VVVGKAVDREEFDEEEYARFSGHLRRCLEALDLVLRRPDFGRGGRTIGAELEMFLVDAGGRPLPLNQKVLSEIADPRVTHELARFNLECNLEPVSFAGRPFSAFRGQLEDTLRSVRKAAKLHRGHLAVIGILPTLTMGDLGPGALTETPRYRALSARMRLRRGEPFQVRIDGRDPLRVSDECVSLEGATTSFQLHLRVSPEEFTRYYNAAQIATAPALAVAGNSPSFLGHLLWDETRIPLFEHATDIRPTPAEGPPRSGASRITFGRRWVETSPFELFQESVDLYEPVLPIFGEEDPLAVARGGGVPKLSELRVHQGTIWRWNRAIYDHQGGGHLRIEFRALPAGPSIPDMLANAAYLLGLTVALSHHSEALAREMPFLWASRNFYRAAQLGLNARFGWPAGGQVRRIEARTLVLRLLPLAREGLQEAGVEPSEIDPLLETIELRARTGRTGAAWQRAALAAWEPTLGRRGGLLAMLQQYQELAQSGSPVHLWPVR
jgi:hypothetical protein